MDDVVAATAAAAGMDSSMVVDKLFIYEWKKGRDNGYFCDLAYSQAVNRTPADVFQSASFYAVYVDTMTYTRVRFVIPPTISGVEQPVAKACAPGDRVAGWNIRVRGESARGASLGSVICAYLPSKHGSLRLPLPPSFSRVCMGLRERGAPRLLGAAMDTEIRDRGRTYELVLQNDSETPQNIACVIEGLETLPDGVTAQVYNARCGQWESGGILNVDLAKRSSQSRLLVVGPPQYHEKIRSNLTQWKLQLAGVYPNPFGSRMVIRYSVPFAADIGELEFSLHDMQGKKIWEQVVAEGFVAGPNELAVDRAGPQQHLASGAYILKMIARDSRSNAIAAFKTRVFCVK
jgi:hypothetical protein